MMARPGLARWDAIRVSAHAAAWGKDVRMWLADTHSSLGIVGESVVGSIRVGLLSAPMSLAFLPRQGDANHARRCEGGAWHRL